LTFSSFVFFNSIRHDDDDDDDDATRARPRRHNGSNATRNDSSDAHRREAKDSTDGRAR